ncbi:GAF domain-containing protein, partial [Salmonella enterica]|nr:GAF domain-containing protein [Salmonella enterica]
MKNKKLRRMTWIYALRGFVFGVVIALVVFLLAADSDAYHESRRTLSDFIRVFPAFWVMTLLPLLCAAAGYLVAWRMSIIIRSMNKALKAEEVRSNSVLQFVEGLSAGKLDVKIAENKDDELITSLVQLQKSLKQNQKEDAKRREEEQQRTWVTKGVAEFGEILRRNNDNMQELSYNIIRYLVDYVQLTQAGFFLLHTGEEKGDNGKKFFELTSFIAYDRRKYAEKTIEWGEGLVGRCALEQRTIYMTELPEHYVTVTSGLGEGDPTAIILVPLK